MRGGGEEGGREDWRDREGGRRREEVAGEGRGWRMRSGMVICLCPPSFMVFIKL